jgi:microcystin-dependent protein
MTITKPNKTYNFVPSTVAKALEVNTNFDNAFGVYDTTGYLYDGWFALSGATLEYHSADAVKGTAMVNLTDDIQIGDKLTFEQSSTEKFFTVININYNTTVANRTYIQLSGDSVANSAIPISTVGFSRLGRPSKYPRTLALEIYPIGSIYTSVVNTNPSTYFGGTWTAFASGRTLVGVDTGQTEFDTVEETGGAKTHTLTSGEMPSHTHTQNSHNHTQNSHNHTQDSHNHTQNSHNHTQNSHNHGTGIYGAGGNRLDAREVYDNQATANQRFTASVTATNQATTATNQATTATNQATTATNQNTTATNQATTATNQNTGGGAAHNNLQPYITVYFWKRTA